MTLKPRWYTRRRDAASAREFWDRLDNEIERARRHGRTFSVSRLRIPASDHRTAHAVNARIRSRVRRVDDVGRLGAHVLIVWSECARDDAVRSTLRVARAFASADDWTELAPRVVEFPMAGVTRAALLDAINEPAAALPAVEVGAARSRDLRAELARPA